MKDRAYEIAINPKYDLYERELASVVYRITSVKQKESEFKWSASTRIRKEKIVWKV